METSCVLIHHLDTDDSRRSVYTLKFRGTSYEFSFLKIHNSRTFIKAAERFVDMPSRSFWILTFGV
ncbi:hypothetical protein J437_LFUL005745 [Ladona fulva]|uniref:Uncharacterized protein n=1 Tax=Ladona fulva TaxID=123851 RepID=A0A8K0K1P7_LADFU|nr:hypothetical protein J437_LFUL005745 [Ladona fulva]